MPEYPFLQWNIMNKLRVLLQSEVTFTTAGQPIVFGRQHSYLRHRTKMYLAFRNPTFELNRETVCEQAGERCEVNNIFIHGYSYFYTTAFGKAFEASGTFNKVGIQVRTKWEGKNLVMFMLLWRLLIS